MAQHENSSFGFSGDVCRSHCSKCSSFVSSNVRI